MGPKHILPARLPPGLDLRQPPADPAKAKNYAELLTMLDELGRMLDGAPDRSDFRQWERRVTERLAHTEIDVLMRPGSEDYDIGNLPEERWQNLRRILLRRKGLA